MSRISAGKTDVSRVCLLFSSDGDYSGRTAGTVALKIAYGYKNENQEFKTLVKDTEDALHMFAIAALPGVFLVDTLPICEYPFTLCLLFIGYLNYVDVYFNFMQ